MMKFTVPEGAAAGQKLRVKAASGETIEVDVPQNAQPGDVLKINIGPSAQPGTADVESEPLPGLPQANFGGTESEGLELTETEPLDHHQIGTIDAKRNPLTLEQPQEQVKLKVNIPPFGFPGKIITIDKPSGGAVLFTVPPGCQPGETVTVSVPAGAPHAPPAAAASIEPAMDSVKIRIPHSAMPETQFQVQLADGRTVAAVVPLNGVGGGMMTIRVPKVVAGYYKDAEAPRQSPKDLYEESDYPNGDADVVLASLNTGLTFNELVQVIWRKKDTIFRCDMATIGPALYQFLDQDGDGAVTLDEIMDAVNSEQLLEYVNSIKCPILTKLFTEDKSKMMSSFKVREKQLDLAWKVVSCNHQKKMSLLSLSLTENRHEQNWRHFFRGVDGVSRQSSTRAAGLLPKALLAERPRVLWFGHGAGRPLCRLVPAAWFRAGLLGRLQVLREQQPPAARHVQVPPPQPIFHGAAKSGVSRGFPDDFRRRRTPSPTGK
jgi:hypothetical protein